VLKSNRQAKSLLREIVNKVSNGKDRLMQRDTKNLKISPEVHFKLKLQAHEHGIPIMDYADLLLTLAMSEHEIWKEQRTLLSEALKKKKP
jgi:hypothetical protein